MVFRWPTNLPKCFGLAAVCVFAIMWTSNASAATITLMSGNGSIGSPDPNVTATDSCVGTTTQATIVSPISTWASPIGDSQWVSTNASTVGCNGTYQTMFTLPADATSPSLTVTELADNSVDVSLNGSQAFITGNVPGQCQFDYGGPPVMGTTTSGLVLGVNMLTFSVDNCWPAWGSQQPSGLDFVATVTYGESPPPVLAPTVVTGYPTNLQPTSLTMTGEVNPNGLPVTSCHFDLYSHPYEYVLLYTVPCAQSVGGGSQTVNVTANVTGLSPGTDYAYQLSAVNAGGTGTDSGVVLTTPFPPLTIIPKQSKSLLDLIGGTVMEVGGAFGCGVALVGEVPTAGLDTVASEVTCAGAVYGGAALAHLYADPPSPDYRTVFVPKPFPMPRVPVRCTGLRITPTRCRALRSAEKRYVRAVARADSLAEAAAVTSDRYGGAIRAGNMSEVEMQATAEHKYLPKLMTAMSEAKKAGRQLGRQLARDHLNPTFSAKQVAHVRKRLMKLQSIPHWVIARLETDGAISSAADLKEIIDKFLVNAPRAKPTKLAAAFEAW